MIICAIFVIANNLYGYAMSESLPLKDFKWLKETEYAQINWLEIDTENNNGYILEVDLSYPKDLHELHSDFQLAPIKRKIKF